MTRRASWPLLALGILATGIPLPAHAQRHGVPLPASEPDPRGEARTDDQVKAQQHFQHAKELYQGGSYREAIAELEAARTLDPKAKDLVFNLGVVHEKLGKFDEALEYFRTYLEMEVTPQERAKAEGIIKRIEGAKHEVPVKPGAGTTAVSPPTSPERDRPPTGRVDAATITAAAVAVAGFGVGTVFGIRALTTQPTDFVTGRDGSYDALREMTDDAHTSAIICDIGLGVGVVASLAAAYLYFARTKTPQAPAQGASRPIAARASFVPGGGVVFLGGSFR